MRHTILAAAFVILFSTTISAADSQRYLVATKRPFHAGALGAVMRDARAGFEPRDVTGFATFDGFAANLSDAEVATLRKSGEVRWI